VPYGDPRGVDVSCERGTPVLCSDTSFAALISLTAVVSALAQECDPAWQDTSEAKDTLVRQPPRLVTCPTDAHTFLADKRQGHRTEDFERSSQSAGEFISEKGFLNSFS
jgi:hypothetical protein